MILRCLFRWGNLIISWWWSSMWTNWLVILFIIYIIIIFHCHLKFSKLLKFPHSPLELGGLPFSLSLLSESHLHYLHHHYHQIKYIETYWIHLSQENEKVLVSNLNLSSMNFIFSHILFQFLMHESVSLGLSSSSSSISNTRELQIFYLSSYPFVINWMWIYILTELN